MLRSGADYDRTPRWNGSIVSIKGNQDSHVARFRRRDQGGRGVIGCAVLVVLAVLLVAGCQGDDPDPVEVEGGDPETGAELIVEYGCGECHLIPGIEGADGGDAPGLQLWPNRAFVAGGLPNNPENTRRFIQNPDEIRPGTEMPDLGVTEQDARHITAYLFTLN